MAGDRASLDRYSTGENIAYGVGGATAPAACGRGRRGGAAILGAIVGPIVGLLTYAPTAPFAVVELAFPATVAGAAAGLLIGLVALILRRIVQQGGQ